MSWIPSFMMFQTIQNSEAARRARKERDDMEERYRQERIRDERGRKRQSSHDDGGSCDD